MSLGEITYCAVTLTLATQSGLLCIVYDPSVLRDECSANVWHRSFRALEVEPKKKQCKVPSLRAAA